MTSSRRTGGNGERRFRTQFNKLVGREILHRNLDQVRDGGYDLKGIPQLAIEIKNCKTLALPAWWRQTLRQAKDTNRIPVLAYKATRGWNIVLPLHIVCPHVDKSFDLDRTATIRMTSFVELFKSLWDAEDED
jgi:hypothetical protein